VAGPYAVTPFPTTNALMIAFGAPSGTLALSAGYDAAGNQVLPYFTVANDPNSPPGGTWQAVQTGANTCPAGCDPSFRPVAPALFCTDITAKNTNKGDWQITGGMGHAPDFVSGTWKNATSAVACTDNGSVTTCTPTTTVGSDPLLNVTSIQNPTTWIAGPNAEPPIGGYATLNTTTSVKLEKYGSEVRWNVDNQALTCIDDQGNTVPFEQPGHVYRVQVLIHDGDQNKAGGDSGQACSTVAFPPVLPPNTP
jgi:hypothetical protein